MNNDLASARLSLQEATDLQPKNLQAWAMLALLQIQQNQMEEVEMKHNPSSECRAKELATKAMKKLKKETMMGKISN